MDDKATIATLQKRKIRQVRNGDYAGFLNALLHRLVIDRRQ
ncbi:MAG: hypothetical protein WAW61_20935 [Methylococcaceae bacterium]